MRQSTFIIDCHKCKAKVAATQKGMASRTYANENIGYPEGEMIQIGECQSCGSLLVGFSTQIGFEGLDSEVDSWSDNTRVYPKPPKTFASSRIPKAVTASLAEADRSLQAGAHIAACAMLGRALEALCRDMLDSDLASGTSNTSKPGKPVMLAQGIKHLRTAGLIDDRLYEWSQQLHAFRNLAAHPEEVEVPRRDAEDLQSFVYAIVEYVYDLADRYKQFKDRQDRRKHKEKFSGKRKTT